MTRTSRTLLPPLPHAVCARHHGHARTQTSSRTCGASSRSTATSPSHFGHPATSSWAKATLNSPARCAGRLVGSVVGEREPELEQWPQRQPEREPE
eukprot:365808-Chlamydomonas_euryale.AAC.24